MALTVSQVSEWLVLNGYSKVDGRPAKGGGYLLNSPDSKHWSLLDYQEYGCNYISITPDNETAEGVDSSLLLELKLDASLQLRIEGNRVVSAYINEHFSGEAIACAKQPPATTDDLRALLQMCGEMFRQMVIAMEEEGSPQSNEDIAAELLRYMQNNPQALELFTTPEEAE